MSNIIRANLYISSITLILIYSNALEGNDEISKTQLFLPKTLKITISFEPFRDRKNENTFGSENQNLLDKRPYKIPKPYEIPE